MNTRPPMIMTASSVTVILQGKSHTIYRDHPSWKNIRRAIKEQDWNALPDLIDVKAAIGRWTQGRYTVTETEVLCDGERLPPAIEERVLMFLNEGLSFEYLLKFHERLDANPSHRAVTELYDFLENKNIPIGADGCFYAYKAVRSDWKDIYSGTIDNSIGTSPEMPRNKVDDNRDRTCSKGLHVGGLQYVKLYGQNDSRYVIVKVDPANVVSVPRDHNAQKVRVSTYDVIEEYTGPLPETVYGQDVPDWVEDEWEDESWNTDEKYCLGCDDWLEVDFSATQCPTCSEKF